MMYEDIRIRDILKERATHKAERFYRKLNILKRHIKREVKDIERSKSFYGIYIIVYLLNILDLLFTDLFGGASIEGNPIGLLIMKTRTNMYMHKIFAMGAIILILYLARRMKVARIGIWVCFGCYTLLVLWHIYIFTRVIFIFLSAGITPVF